MDPDNPFRRVPKYDPISAERNRVLKMNQRQREMLQQELLQRHRLLSLVNQDLDPELKTKTYHTNSRRKINNELNARQREKERIVLHMRLPSQLNLDDYIGRQMKYHTLGRYNFGSKTVSLPRLRADLHKVLTC